MSDKSSSGSLRFVEPDFLDESLEDHAASAGRQRAATLPGRPYGALPRALTEVPAGYEHGILETPYRRYGSPYPRHHSGYGGDGEEDVDSDEIATSGFSSKHNSTGSAVLYRRHTNDGITSTDQGDESLQRYKESLGLGGGGTDLSDPNDPRVCIIYSLALHSDGRDPVVVDLSAPGSEQTLKDKPFKIKEGAKFTMTAKFKVQHEILSGLHYVQSIKRKGVRLPGGKTSEMIGSFAPNTDKNPVYEKKFAEEEAPSGMLARGHYTAHSSFVDDDKKTHLAFEWSFDIAKDW
ncbi:immunoglobulin E-set [Cercophora newfieldiana]|uniref:Immunoglobulin E-set n=1 Tax=Cercophora newfieldiana TaxID=92897 RepID=A0AA40CLB8_9PEZI|nr:immunoglobulin E-set [Cercophora newfieldiana]